MRTRRTNTTARVLGRAATPLVAAAAMVLSACTTSSSSSPTSTAPAPSPPGSSSQPVDPGPTDPADLPDALALLQEPSLSYTRTARTDFGGGDQVRKEAVTVDLGAGTIHHRQDDGGELIRTADAVYRRTSSAECGPWLVLGPAQTELETGGAESLAVEPLAILSQAADLSGPSTTADGDTVYETTVPSGLAVRGAVVGASRLNAMRSPLTVTVSETGAKVDIRIDASDAFREMARGMAPDVVSTTTWIVEPGRSETPVTVPTDAVDDPACQTPAPGPVTVGPSSATTEP